MSETFKRPLILYVPLVNGPFGGKSVPFTASEYDEGPPRYLEIAHSAKIAITLDGQSRPVVEGHATKAYCLYGLYERVEPERRIGRDIDYCYVAIATSLRVTESAVQKVSSLLKDTQ